MSPTDRATSAGQGLERFLERFEEAFPAGAEIRKFFRVAEADPIFAAPVPADADAPRGSWFLLVRLPSKLEERFGLSREFLVLCTEVPDVQTRLVRVARQLFAKVDRPIDRSLICITSADSAAPQKMRDWALEHSERLTVIPLVIENVRQSVATADASLALPRLFQEWLFARDLYDERVPVTGDRFFGRTEELRTAESLLVGGGHAGIFGLRKIGKTSFLRQLHDRLREKPEVTSVLLDLQASAAAGSAAHVAHRLGDELVKTLSRQLAVSRQEITSELRLRKRWDDEPERKTLSDIADGMQALFEHNELATQRIVVILDEIEVLFPSSGTPFPFASEFFRGLRSLAQRTDRLTIAIAGVNSYPSETATIGGVDNPLFGLLSRWFLGPLEPDACREMIRRVGKKIGIDWEHDASRALVEDVGGHPLLARIAASDVLKLEVVERPAKVSAAMVFRVLRQFPQRHHSELSEITESLRRYYPEEFELLRLAADGDVLAVNEWRREYPDAFNHLEGYGIFDADRVMIKIPALERWLKR